MELKNTYTVIGLMSGTSLDGLDLALCTFTKNKNKWTYKIIEAKTFAYNKTWKQKLQNAHILNGQGFGSYMLISENSLLKQLISF